MDDRQGWRKCGRQVGTCAACQNLDHRDVKSRKKAYFIYLIGRYLLTLPSLASGSRRPPGMEEVQQRIWNPRCQSMPR
jgi:hypothetical protein